MFSRTLHIWRNCPPNQVLNLQTLQTHSLLPLFSHLHPTCYLEMTRSRRSIWQKSANIVSSGSYRINMIRRPCRVVHVRLSGSSFVVIFKFGSVRLSLRKVNFLVLSCSPVSRTRFRRTIYHQPDPFNNLRKWKDILYGCPGWILGSCPRRRSKYRKQFFRRSRLTRNSCHNLHHNTDSQDSVLLVPPLGLG